MQNNGILSTVGLLLISLLGTSANAQIMRDNPPPNAQFDDNDPIDGAFVEIGDDNDNDDEDRGRLDLLDDDDANDPNGNDGEGALIEAFYDRNDEDGTLLDLGDLEDLIRIDGEYPFGDGLLNGGLLGDGLLGSGLLNSQ